MDARERELERQAALGDGDAAARLAALRARRLAPPPPPEYGLLISGHGRTPRTLERTTELVAELRGSPLEEARDRCRAPVVPVLRGKLDLALVEAAAARFQALGVRTRVTTKRGR